jgi:hypothetical protein
MGVYGNALGMETRTAEEFLLPYSQNGELEDIMYKYQGDMDALESIPSTQYVDGYDNGCENGLDFQ